MTDPDPPEPGDLDELLLSFDAALEAKDAWERGDADAPTTGVVVSSPGASSGGGPRGARRTAATTGEDNHLRHNWIPIGPRNIGGRIRALVAHPTDPMVRYAGSASGGVWKTVDGAQSWFPLWHDETSLSIGAMAICRGRPEVVWAATGEIDKQRGNGVYVSTDNGGTWTNRATPPVVGNALTFDAIAAHPTNILSAWAVGPAGILRTSDGGASWDRFRTGEYFSDVAYSTDTAGGPTLFLVKGASAAGEAVVVHLPNPDDTTANITAILPATPAPIPPVHLSTVIAAPGPPVPVADARPARGKIAIASAAPGTAYVRFVDGQGRHVGVFRSDNAQQAPGTTGNAINWARMVDAGGFADADQGQGRYNLTVAATPDGQHVATGMVDLYLLHGAHLPAAIAPNPDTWLRAMSWPVWAQERGHHGDHHATVFAADPDAPGTPALWSGNDGGVSISRNWLTGTGHSSSPRVPLPATAISWEKVSEGILAAQMYDLNLSPQVPGVVACGFQDNGVFLTAGGPTWTMVIGADGGFVAFDPDDPYRLLTTWQGGITEIHLPGLLSRVVQPVGSSVNPWPRSLQTGFSGADRPPFVATTVHDPRRGRRVLTARRNVLYGRTRTTGERWQPLPLGRAVELRHEIAAATATLEVLPSGAAGKLGLVPQVGRGERDGRTAVARCFALVDGPYRLADGDQLRFSVDGVPAPPVVFRGAAFADITQATAVEVAAVLNAVRPGIAQAVLVPPATTVTLVARTAGASLTLGGTGLATVGGSPGTVTADAGQHAMVVLTPAFSAVGGLTLTVQVAAGPVTTVALDGLAGPDGVGALARLLRSSLPKDAVGVGLHDLEHFVSMSAAAPATVTLAGTAVTAVPAPLTVTPAAPAVRLRTAKAPFGLANVPAHTLTVGDGTNSATVTVDAAAGFANPAAVSAHDLRRAVVAAVAAAPAAARPAVTVALELDVKHRPDWKTSAEGEISEIAFCAGDPDHVWAGDTSGWLHHSADGGARWTSVVIPEIADRHRDVSAILVHPNDPDRMLVGLGGPLSFENYLYRTTDGGRSFSAVGGDVVEPNGASVGVNGIDGDPDDPDVVWLATDTGVWRSANFGGSWEPYNHGLPRCRVIDVAYQPLTRVLAAGAWGRGVYQRHVGDEPPRDVALVVRSSLLDDGTRPAPRGADVVAVPPAPVESRSPDVKVTRRVGAARVGRLLDGVELDERVQHEPPTPGLSTVCVQVHNRGAFPTRGVRVTALWAPLAAGRPPQLRDDLHVARAAGALAVDAVFSGWRVIGDGTVPSDAQDHDVVAAGQPRVMRFAYTWPAAVSDTRQIAILALVSSPDDADLSREPDVERLIARERKAALRVTDTTRPDEDQIVVLRSTSGRPFTLDAPTGGGLSPAAALALPLGAAAAPVAVSAAAPTYDLATGGPFGFRIRMDQTAVVSFASSPDIANLAAVTADDWRTVVERDLFATGVPVRGRSVGAPPRRPRLLAQGAAQVRVSGGTAAAPLGFVVGAPGAFANPVDGAVAETWNLSVGAPLDLQLEVRYDHEISFPAGTPEIPTPATAQAHEIRAAINRQLEHTGIPVVAEPARVELLVRRSITEPVRGGVTGGEQLADVVAAPDPVVGDAAQRALFDLLTVHGLDRVRRDHDNRLYLRSANRGNIPVVGARHRLWSIDLAGPGPFVPVPLGAAVPADLAPGASVITEFPWNPGAVAADLRFLVLAVVDRDPAGVVDPPAQFATLDEIDAFTQAAPGAATRLFVIGG